MKTILNFMILAGILLLAGCHDITVGYLFTDEAEYAPNEMEVTNIDERMVELQTLLEEFTTQAGTLQDEYDRLDAVYQQKQEEYDALSAIINPIQDSIDNKLDLELDDDKIAELQKRLDEELYPQQEALEKEVNEADAAVHKAELELQQLADKLGITSSATLRSDIRKLQDRKEYGVPWVVTEMQGIQGTEPLIYEIVSVTNENAANAEKFRGYLRIVGGGKMYLQQDFDVPAGRYVVTVKVSNEGRSRIFQDAFTFVVRHPAVSMND